jgi:hypothetical protein
VTVDPRGSDPLRDDEIDGRATALDTGVRVTGADRT